MELFPPVEAFGVRLRISGGADRLVLTGV